MEDTRGVGTPRALNPRARTHTRTFEHMHVLLERDR